MSIMVVRDHRTVAKYEDHYEGRSLDPCPACGNCWSEPDPIDRSRELVHAQGCDWLVWLREDDQYEDDD